MKITDLSELEPAQIRAVIINVRTELVSTLALASALKHADCPVLLINCEPTRDSDLYFDELARDWNFDILTWPARPHGEALDQLFAESKDEFLMLLDSDAELVNDRFFVRVLAELNLTEDIFGSGFTHGPTWLSDKEKTGEGNVLYQVRPWIPCVGLRVSHVREAISHGISFVERTVRYEEELHLMRFGETDTDAMSVDAVFCDTGSNIYNWNIFVKQRHFIGPDVYANGDVLHYHGVTRLFHSPVQDNGTRIDDITNEITDRLIGTYQFNFIEFVSKLAQQSAV